MSLNFHMNFKIIIERNIDLDKHILKIPSKIVRRRQTQVPIGARGRKRTVTIMAMSVGRIKSISTSTSLMPLSVSQSPPPVPPKSSTPKTYNAAKRANAARRLTFDSPSTSASTLSVGVASSSNHLMTLNFDDESFGKLD